ncbi:MAG: histidinol phosphate phosphatase HisJ family [Paenibacillus sp.]|nr:histidinol phosphate phosphatase HisJ family [Paenibacillus sp.]
MKFDLHTHHSRCGHAVGQIEDYIQSAIRVGLQVIGISDHSPFFAEEEDHARPGMAMPRSEFLFYVEEVLNLKHKYEDRIEVLLGVESDFFAESTAVYQSYFQKYPFDYLIGSIHYVEGIHIFHKQFWSQVAVEDVEKRFRRYYDLVIQAVRSQAFDIFGHLDALRGNCPFTFEPSASVTDHVLQEAASSGVVLEVNTSGKLKLASKWFPSDELLERALFYGLGITFGSDAHKPERVGEEQEEVRKRLKEIGYTEWYIFRKRVKQRIPL